MEKCHEHNRIVRYVVVTSAGNDTGIADKHCLQNIRDDTESQTRIEVIQIEIDAM